MSPRPAVRRADPPDALAVDPTGGSTPVSRREAGRQRTRRALYEAAIALFVEHGFDAVTVERIVAAAGVSRRTFFLHFPTKDAVLFEYGRRLSDEVASCLERSGGSAEQRLRAALAVLTARALDTPAFSRLAAHQVFSKPAHLLALTEGGRTLASLLAGVVRGGQQAGELRRDCDPELAALQITGAFFVASAAWLEDGTRFDLPQAVEQILTTHLDGIRTRKGGRPGPSRPGSGSPGT